MMSLQSRAGGQRFAELLGKAPADQSAGAVHGSVPTMSTPAAPLRIVVDDLTGAPTRALIARHLAGMTAYSPPGGVHALDVDKLRAPEVTFFSAWMGDAIAACGALKRLDRARGELKSMRVADAFLGRGVGRAMLLHLVAEARACGMTSLWLETGSGEAFQPALRLYERAGFVRCSAFEGYTANPFSVFMTRAI
jgi:putative acetyltransferase